MFFIAIELTLNKQRPQNAGEQVEYYVSGTRTNKAKKNISGRGESKCKVPEFLRL